MSELQARLDAGGTISGDPRMTRAALQRALAQGGAVAIDGVVRVDKPLVIDRPTQITGGLLIGDADAVLLDVRAPSTLTGTELVRTGGFGHVLRTSADLTLKIVTLSGGRRRATHDGRRPAYPTEALGAGILVGAGAALRATTLHVSGCTGAGVHAVGSVRWTGGSARTCEWGLFAQGDARVSRVTFDRCSLGIRQDAGVGGVQTSACRFLDNGVAVASNGPAPMLIRKGLIRTSQAGGVLAHVAADLTLDGVCFEGNREYSACAAGWASITAEGCSVADGDPGAKTFDAGLIAGWTAHHTPTDLKAALRSGLSDTPARAALVARLGRSPELAAWVPVAEILVAWGPLGLDWLDGPGRRVVWHAPLSGHGRAIQRDVAGRIWLLSDDALITDGVRIAPGGHCFDVGALVAVAGRDGVALHGLDGAPLRALIPPAETAEIHAVRVVDANTVQAISDAGLGLDRHEVVITWELASGLATVAWTGEGRPPPVYLSERIESAPWLDLVAWDVHAVWHEGDVGAFILKGGHAVVVERGAVDRSGRRT